MEISLVRRKFTEQSTIGDLFLDGERECLTLEDRAHEGPKIPGQTAIPEGRYEITINWSSRFHRPLPLLLDVPDFSGIRIHPGNGPKDTQGCILVGRIEGEDWIGESRIAFEALFIKLQAAILKEKIHILISRS